MKTCQCGRELEKNETYCGICIPASETSKERRKGGLLGRIKGVISQTSSQTDSVSEEEASDIKSKIQAQLAEKLEQAFEVVMRQKDEQYKKAPQKIPCKEEVRKLISDCALSNAGISGGASLMPGPAGMVAVIPEVMMVTRSQIGLVYDIAAAHGKKDLMTKDLAAMVFASALGRGAGSLLIMKGGDVIVRQLSKGVLKTLFNKVLAGRIAHSVIKSSVSKWLPGVGAAAMAAWSNYTTRKIGERANRIFASDLKFQGTLSDKDLVE